MIDIEDERLINKRSLLQLVPLAYTTIWKMIRRGEFPAGVVVSGRVLWKLSEVKAWLDTLPRSKYAGIDAASDRTEGGE